MFREQEKRGFLGSPEAGVSEREENGVCSALHYVTGTGCPFKMGGPVHTHQACDNPARWAVPPCGLRGRAGVEEGETGVIFLG